MYVVMVVVHAGVRWEAGQQVHAGVRKDTAVLLQGLCGRCVSVRWRPWRIAASASTHDGIHAVTPMQHTTTQWRGWSICIRTCACASAVAAFALVAGNVPSLVAAALVCCRPTLPAHYTA